MAEVQHPLVFGHIEAHLKSTGQQSSPAADHQWRGCCSIHLQATSTPECPCPNRPTQTLPKNRVLGSAKYNAVRTSAGLLQNCVGNVVVAFLSFTTMGLLVIQLLHKLAGTSHFADDVAPNALIGTAEADASDSGEGPRPRESFATGARLERQGSEQRAIWSLLRKIFCPPRGFSLHRALRMDLFLGIVRRAAAVVGKACVGLPAVDRRRVCGRWPRASVNAVDSPARNEPLQPLDRICSQHRLKSSAVREAQASPTNIFSRTIVLPESQDLTAGTIH